MTVAAIDHCQVAAAHPPNGVTSNFINPTTLAPTVIGVLSVLSAWAIIFVAARLYVNWRKLSLADLFVVIALLESLAILVILSTSARTFRHVWDVPACFFDADFAKGIYIPALLLSTGAFFAKTSIFLLVRQLFQPKRGMSVAIWIGIVFCFLLYSTGVAITTYYAAPRPGETWVTRLNNRSSIPFRWWQVQAALIVVLDLYIFILPLPAIHRLTLPIRQRLQIAAQFSLAALGIGASIASLYVRIDTTLSFDSTWIAAILKLCTTIELDIAIIVGSAPAFAAFIRTTLPSMSIVTTVIYSLICGKRSRVSDHEAGYGRFPDRARKATRTRPAFVTAKPEMVQTTSSLAKDSEILTTEEHFATCASDSPANQV